MKKFVLSVAALSLFAAGSAHATSDSVSYIKVPMSRIHTEGYCLANVLAWNGVSTSAASQVYTALLALGQKIEIPAFHPGSQINKENINALSESGLSLSFEEDQEKYDEGKLTIDASRTPRGTADERQIAINNVKLAIVAAAENSVVDGVIKKLKIELKGLPKQDGLTSKVPTSFKSAFTKNSPYLKSIKKEMMIGNGDTCTAE